MCWSLCFWLYLSSSNCAAQNGVSINLQLTGPSPVGNDLALQPFRWDQRVFATVLRWYRYFFLSSLLLSSCPFYVSPWVTSQLSFLLCVECNHLAKEQTLKNSWSSHGMYFDPSSTAQDKQWNWCQFRFFPLLLWDWNTWIAMSSELYNFWYLPRYCVYVKKPLTESSFSVVSQDTICKCCSFREKWTYSSKCSHLWSTICFGYGHQHFTILWVHRVSIWTGTWSVQPVITEDEKHVSWVAVAEWCMLDWTYTKTF